MRKIEIKKTIYFPKIDTELKLWKINDVSSLKEQNYISVNKRGKIKTEFIENEIKAKQKYDLQENKLQKIEDTYILRRK